MYTPSRQSWRVYSVMTCISFAALLKGETLPSSIPNSRFNLNICSFEKASAYRTALRELRPRPTEYQLKTGLKLHLFLIKHGCMRHFFDIPMDITRHTVPSESLGTKEVIKKSFDPGLIKRICLSTTTRSVPLFTRLFKREPIARECIICAEQKFEVKYDGLLQLEGSDAEFADEWKWRILEYPTKFIQQCNHELEVCRECYDRHICVSMETGNIDSIACLQCDRVFSHSEVNDLATLETFRR